MRKGSWTLGGAGVWWEMAWGERVAMDASHVAEGLSVLEAGTGLANI